MKKGKHIYIKTLLTAAFLGCLGLFGSCVNDEPFGNGPSDEGTEFELFITRTGVSTRSVNGESFTLAEKKVNSVHLYFFPAELEEGDETQSIFSSKAAVQMATEGSISNTGKLRVNIPRGTLEDGFSYRVFAIVNSDCAQNSPKLSIKELKDLKAKSESFRTKRLSDENNVSEVSGFEGFVMFTVDDRGDLVSYEEAENKLTGKVIVNKLTSKIDLFVGYGPDGGSADDYVLSAQDPKDPSGETKRWKVYQPTGEGVEVFLVNGVDAIRIGGYDKEMLQPEDYFDMRSEELRSYAHGMEKLAENNKNPDKDTYPYVTKAPFYTYPNDWTSDILEQRGTSLMLKVNWIEEGSNIEENIVETYYSIPIATEDLQYLKSNSYYRIKVRINTMGGLHFGSPVELECSYEILPWGTKNIKANLRDTRFLELNQEVLDRDGNIYTAVMNNVDEITIPYYTSHELVLREAKITYYTFANYVGNMNDGNQSKIDLPYIPIEQNILFLNSFVIKEEDKDSKFKEKDLQGVYFDYVNQTLTLKHPVGLSSFQFLGREGYYAEMKYPYLAYVPYIIELKVQHYDKNDNTYIKTIKIRHNPGIYMEAEVNESYNLTGKTSANLHDFPLYDCWRHSSAQLRYYGFVRVNSDDYETRNFGGISFSVKGGVWSGRGVENPIMYIINATQLNDDWKLFHIGDPRADHYNNDLSGEFLTDLEDIPVNTESWTPYTARHIDGGDARQLEFYYPTKEGLSDADKYAISPRFRMASGFGSQQSLITREDARKRCASYTEYGYPAGRWRVPSLGELMFMQQLQAWGLIPELFNQEYVYFTAQGPYKFGPTGPVPDNGKDGGVVRCIYDDWYWDKKEDGSPDRLTTPEEMYNEDPNSERWSSSNGAWWYRSNPPKTFIWGDRYRKNPQQQVKRYLQKIK